MTEQEHNDLLARVARLEEQNHSQDESIKSLTQSVHGDGYNGLVPRLNRLEERAHWGDRQTDDVDSMVHGDGSNSGLIANVNTLQSQMKMLMWLLPIGSSVLASLVAAAVIFIANVVLS